jgi:hypothetical protein
VLALCSATGVANLLLECAKSESSIVSVSSMTESKPIQSSAWVEAGAKQCGMMAPIKTIVQRRCGAENEWDESVTICANHLKLLTDNFPMDPHCGVCRETVNVSGGGGVVGSGVHHVTVAQSEKFSRYLPHLVLGQTICSMCFKKLLVVQAKENKKQTRSEAAIAHMLHHQKIVDDETLKSILDKCRQRFLAAVEKRRANQMEEGVTQEEKGGGNNIKFANSHWTILQLPFTTVNTSVPPLR